jgi:ABC-type histidine transport system ATPase subunit
MDKRIRIIQKLQEVRKEILFVTEEMNFETYVNISQTAVAILLIMLEENGISRADFDETLAEVLVELKINEE